MIGIIIIALIVILFLTVAETNPTSRKYGQELLEKDKLKKR